MDLAPLLVQIVKQQVPDVRVALAESKDQLLKRIVDGDPNPVQGLHNLSFSQASG